MAEARAQVGRSAESVAELPAAALGSAEDRFDRAVLLQGLDELQVGLVNHRVAGWKFLVEFPAVFYFYPLYLYFNFAGYCDIVIAANRFFGMNFRRTSTGRISPATPSTSGPAGTSRWEHGSATTSSCRCTSRWSRRWPKRARSLAWVFYFLAFVVAGAWHGTTLNFLFYGIWQGIGVSATKLYETWLLARHGRKGLSEYLQSPKVRLVAILLNLHFQFISMLIFSQRDVADSWQMFRGLILAFAGN